MLVLWVMAVLCAVALKLSFSSHLRLQVTASVGEGAQAVYLARAGVERTVAELVQGRDSVQTLDDLRESESTSCTKVELGEGHYTLFAGLDEQGEPTYGIMDEAARINVNTADAAILSKVPGMNTEISASIAALRKHQPFHSVNDLLLIEQVDVQHLFGEDMNGNGLLDPNEDDGDESWPPDNADGRLGRGLTAYLTTWSAAQNVTSEGKKRVNINSADAKSIAKSVPGLTSQEAESIVEHRKKTKFTSIADLLDVELVKKAAEQPKSSTPGGKDKKKSPEPSGGLSATKAKPPTPPKAKEKPVGKSEEKPAAESKERTATEGTGQKAFDAGKLRKIAGAVTTSDEAVLKGLVNINTASHAVLACLPGVTEPLARAIVRVRAQRKEGFETVADLLDVAGMSAEEFRQVCPYISVRSDVFRVLSFGVIEKTKVYRCVEAVIDRTVKTARIRYWRDLE